MRIGILTLHIHRNYGGILQNFALQEILRRMGHNPITLNRCPPRNIVRYYSSQVKYYVYKVLKKNTSGVFYFKHTKRGIKFSHFINRFIKLTTPITSYSYDIINRYKCDAVIVGSDQVWRRAFFSPEMIQNYFGKFMENSSTPYFAYAASFGVDNWEYEETLTQECSKLASRFLAISTREDSGVELCRNLSIFNASPVLDPTMLLKAEDYKKICEGIKERKEKFLFAYLLDCREKNIEIVKKISNKNDLIPLIVKSELDAKYSVEEWLSLIRDCSYVVTDSFHGCVFSILFHKHFNTIINSVRGSGRFNTLLDRFDLKNRLVSDKHEFEESEIDWAKVDLKLNQWREGSFDFLKSSLQKVKAIADKK